MNKVILKEIEILMKYYDSLIRELEDNVRKNPELRRFPKLNKKVDK